MLSSFLRHQLHQYPAALCRGFKCEDINLWTEHLSAAVQRVSLAKRSSFAWCSPGLASLKAPDVVI